MQWGHDAEFLARDRDFFLGSLRAFKGSQRDPIPAGVNLNDHLRVLISPADLVTAR